MSENSFLHYVASNFGCVLIKLEIILFSTSIFSHLLILNRFYGFTLYRKMSSYFAVNERFPSSRLKKGTFGRIIN